MRAAGGCLPSPLFRNPLLASRSPRDFWAERWNLVVHGLLKRTVFKPLRHRGWGTAACAAAAFVASGAFHVYVLHAACRPPASDHGAAGPRLHGRNARERRRERRRGRPARAQCG